MEHAESAALPNRESLAEQLELFFGDAHVGEARVYARLPGVDSSTWQLGGQLIGPECCYSHTLRATIPFRSLRNPAASTEATPAAGVLAEAILPDPCFWSPELPLLYRANIELRGRTVDATNAILQKVERVIGIRRLGVRGKSLYLDGGSWVPRGVRSDRSAIEFLAAARVAQVLLYVREADEAFLSEASHTGIPLAVELAGDGGHLAAELRRLAHWPAAFFAIIDAGQPLDLDPRRVARNILLAAKIRHGSVVSAPTWAQVVWFELANGESVPPELNSRGVPVIVSRPRTSAGDLTAGRKDCDRLQYDVAPSGDFAGYVV